MSKRVLKTVQVDCVCFFKEKKPKLFSFLLLKNFSLLLFILREGFLKGKERSQCPGTITHEHAFLWGGKGEKEKSFSIFPFRFFFRLGLFFLQFLMEYVQMWMGIKMNVSRNWKLEQKRNFSFRKGPQTFIAFFIFVYRLISRLFFLGKKGKFF